MRVDHEAACGGEIVLPERRGELPWPRVLCNHMRRAPERDVVHPGPGSIQERSVDVAEGANRWLDLPNRRNGALAGRTTLVVGAGGKRS